MADAPMFDLDNNGGKAAPARYRARWRVWAVPIREVRVDAHAGAVLVLGDNFAPLTVPATVVRPVMPVEGDYLVILADGTQYIIAAADFAERYERV